MQTKMTFAHYVEQERSSLYRLLTHRDYSKAPAALSVELGLQEKGKNYKTKKIHLVSLQDTLNSLLGSSAFKFKLQYGRILILFPMNDGCYESIPKM